MFHTHYNPLRRKSSSPTGLYLSCILIGLSTVVFILPSLRFSAAKEAPTATKVMESQDTSLQGLKERGQVFFASRKIAAAIETYELLVTKYPQEAAVLDVYIQLVTLYENQKDYANVAKSIERGYHAATTKNDESLKQVFLQMARSCPCQTNITQ